MTHEERRTGYSNLRAERLGSDGVLDQFANQAANRLERTDGKHWRTSNALSSRRNRLYERSILSQFFPQWMPPRRDFFRHAHLKLVQARGQTGSTIGVPLRIFMKR
jgi:type VI protein secretion system component VasK